eukprot:TRINITY_DN6439_c0_g1_i1.p1 TRINITY_DN6439_c0_g1~~TRINITY_DN6439_c0_g1_i1.p1  ORF type:complete len:342 (+),score=96.49 TRINITY_DN6439_c0_g1_i1:129-1154(+)
MDNLKFTYKRKSARRLTTVNSDNIQLQFKKKKIESPSSSQEESNTQTLNQQNNEQTNNTTTTPTKTNIEEDKNSEEINTHTHSNNVSIHSPAHTSSDGKDKEETNNRVNDTEQTIQTNKESSNTVVDSNVSSSSNTTTSTTSTKGKRKLTLMGKKERIAVLQKIIENEIANLEKTQPASLITHLKEFTSLFISQLSNPPPTIVTCNNLNFDLELREKKLLQTLQAWQKEGDQWTKLENTLRAAQSPTPRSHHTTASSHSLPPLASLSLSPREVINATAVKLDSVPPAVTQMTQQNTLIQNYLNHSTSQLYHASSSKVQDTKNLKKRFMDTTPMPPPKPGNE